MLARSTAQFNFGKGQRSLRTGTEVSHSDTRSSTGPKKEKYNWSPVVNPCQAGDAQSSVSGFSGFQPELHSTPKSSVVDLYRPRFSSKPDLLHSVPNQLHVNYQPNDKTKSNLIKGGQSHTHVSSSIDNRQRFDGDIMERSKKSMESNENKDYLTLTENVRKYAGSPSALPELREGRNMDNQIWDRLLEDGHKGLERPSSRLKFSTSAKGSFCSEKSSRLDSHTYQSYTAGLLHSTSRSEKFLNLQKHFAMLERITEIEEKSEKPRGPNSMDKEMFDIVNTSRQEELHELYYELEEAKKNREFFSNIKSNTWDPRKDFSLNRKEKSVGDLKALYSSMDEYSREETPMRKAKSVESSGFTSLESSLQERDLKSPQRTPREVRPIHGTYIEPVVNKYEVYVEEKRNEHKSEIQGKELHVRSVSVPVNEPENSKPLKRAHSSIGNKYSEKDVKREIKMEECCSTNGDNKIMVRHGGKVISRYVNDGVHGENFKGSLSDGIEPANNTNRRKVVTPVLKIESDYQKDYYERNYTDSKHESEVPVFQRHFGEKCVLDSRGKSPWNPSVQHDNSTNNCKTYLQTELEQNQPSSPVQFKVRNLRNLAENNEFSDSKFAKLRSKSDSLSPSATNDNKMISYAGYDYPHEDADDYVRLKKWKTSDLCENDGTTSENSSTDTFIVKGSDDDLEKDGNLPDVTKGTYLGTSSEPVKEKSKSEPDLKQAPEGPVRPRSAKSHVKLNEQTSSNKLPSDFGMPRTVSGNLREVFKQYKDEGKFTRFKTAEPENNHEKHVPKPALDIKAHTLPRRGSRGYDAYIPPSHIMKEVSKASGNYKRADPLGKSHKPSAASKMTVQYFDTIGNEWSQERNRQCIENSRKNMLLNHNKNRQMFDSKLMEDRRKLNQYSHRNQPHNHSNNRREGDYVMLHDNTKMGQVKIKSASLGRHPRKPDYPEDYPEFYYHTWSPKSPTGNKNGPPEREPMARPPRMPDMTQPAPYPRTSRQRTNHSNTGYYHS